MMHSKRTLPLVAVAVVALAGACSTTTGQPEPAATSSDTQSSAPTSSANPLSKLVACDLLDKALKAAGEQFPPGEYSDIGSQNGCQTSKPSVASFTLDIQPGQSLESFGSDPTKLYGGDINGRKAVEQRNVQDVRATCGLALAVQPDSRVILRLVRLKGTTKQTCSQLEDVARKLEPMLPK